MQTSNKISLVTGASRGIGAAIARALGRQGGAVVVHYSTHPDGAEAVCDDIRKAGGKAVAMATDMGSEQDISILFKKIDEKYGSIDTLVNNAGGIIAPLLRFEWVTLGKHSNHPIVRPGRPSLRPDLAA
jgi:3-oxoacyl-[acyl-carrier protein] reductase